MTLVESIIIAVVEGITEFLPVSSTGHMIIASSFMGIAQDDFTKLFEVAIQLGAIGAVLVLYKNRFFPLTRWVFYAKLLVAVVPALLLGALFNDQIDALLESPLTVALSLLLGGIVLLFIDRFFQSAQTTTEKEISFLQAFVIGIFQCLAMVPGVSRSAASIIGGMQQKLSRSLAAEFSFFLAVPTMAAATGYKLLKAYKETPDILQSSSNLGLLLVGNVVAFVVALLAIKFFIGFLQKHGFRLFGWYRIALGLILLVLLYTGHLN
jgi:undecaprenyl-diphosphatase